MRYRGYYYDSETGFYYLQSRYYDPTICRFINADSYVSTGQGFLGNNMFAYCGNNPVNYVDHNGKNADALRTWASTMWWLCASDSVLPLGDIIYVFGFFVFCVDAFSQAEERIDKQKAINSNLVSQASALLDFASTAATPPPPNKGGKETQVTSKDLVYQKRKKWVSY